MTVVAVICFLISMTLCVIGAYIAVFAVTTHKSMNAWVSVFFLLGVIINLTLIVIFTTKP